MMTLSGRPAGDGRENAGIGVACTKLEYSIRVTDAGFEPAELAVPKGTPITLVVTREVSETCATDLVIVGSGKSVPLPLRRSVRIPLPNGVVDTLRYACGMDMFRGTVVAK